MLSSIASKVFITIGIILSGFSVSAQQITGEKIFGNSSYEESWNGIVQLPNTDILVVGSAEMASGDIEYSFSRLTSSGELLWSKTSGSPLSQDYGFDIVLNKAGNVFVCGESHFEDGSVGVFWSEIDTAGNTLWRNDSHDVQNRSIKRMVVLPDGSAIACGYISEADTIDQQNDIFIMKFKADGLLVWEKTYGFSNNDYATSICAHGDGFVLACDVKQSENGRTDYDQYLLKIDSAGNKMWDLLVGNEWENGTQDIITTSGNDLLICGESTGNKGPGFDISLTKLSASGDLIYFRTIDGNGSDAAFSIAEAAPNNYMLCGYSNSNNPELPIDFFVSQINEEAVELGRNYFSGNGIDIGFQLIVPNGSSFYAVGKTEVDEDNQGLLIIGKPTFTGITEQNSSTRSLNIFPQPAQNSLTVSVDEGTFVREISIFNFAGQLVWKQEVNQQQTVELQLPFSKGLYLLEAASNLGVLRTKLILD